MDLGDLRGSIFTAVTFANVVSAKIVGLSWLSWSETFVILIMCLVFSKALEIILTKNNNKETKGE